MPFLSQTVLNLTTMNEEKKLFVASKCSNPHIFAT